ncbi:Spindle- and centromere-associated protein [Toxocara canis]|uniref:Spindle-and centromere-associated protein n=1 Tax=Toxocara canis TaxID=6265 RepID=A0A0B2VLZ0_TOXCA|nr:Spindle- and centromere-associated protein [Toxocara canis]
MVSSETAIYDVSSTVISDIALASSSSLSHSYSAVGLDRDLNSFKKRIDANTEEQREHADLMAGLQRKVEEYRRRIADIERQISAQRPEERVSFSIKEVSENWTPEVAVISTDYELSGQLEEERRRNDELRMQISQLQAEIQRLHQQYELSIQDKDRMSANRERNLAQYLSEEQKKMMDLWAELQQVRRQFAEYRDQTARELENQRNEFARVTRNVGGVVRRLSITKIDESGQSADNELAEAIKRFSEQYALLAGTSTDDYNALMKKYEESIERIVELESRGDGEVGRVAALEAEIRRTKDKLAECQEALRKIHDVTKESEHKGTEKRTRSLSPGGTHVVPLEVLRSVRLAIRSRDNEIQQLLRKLKNAELQISELTTRFEGAEEARKRLEKQLIDSKRELNIQQKAVDDATREVRRLEDRLHAADSEKTVAENARVRLEEEIRRLKLMIDQTAADGEKKALEEAEMQRHIIEEEYKTRIAELTHKIDTLQEDNKRLKGDLHGVKDKFRNLEIEYNTTLRKIDEKGE